MSSVILKLKCTYWKSKLRMAKVKWAIEGDGNLKYFHGLFNNKFAKSRISGMDINEAWVSDPYLVISHVFSYYKMKFKDNSPCRPCFTRNLFISLSDHEISLLDASFFIKEIKDVVWGYGSEKAPGIEGFTFKFIKHFRTQLGMFHQHG
ncbi:hypothetical protein Tco_0644981 [Tanacetum coccineum]